MPKEIDRLHIKGERLAVVELSDDELRIESEILLPSNEYRAHYFVRVVAKGDGAFKMATGMTFRECPDVNVGDIVLVQVNPQLAKDAAFKAGGSTFLIIHWGDAIGKIIDATQPVSSKNIVPVGRWVFTDVKLSLMAGDLVLPDSSTVGEITWKLVAAGSQSGVDLPRGTRLYLERSRASTFSLGDTEDRSEEGLLPKVINCVYVDVNDVLGFYISE